MVDPNKVRPTPKTPQLNNLLRNPSRSDDTDTDKAVASALSEPYSAEQLEAAWSAFAEQRKKFQAEYQMLTQPKAREGDTITVELSNPVQETMLDAIKSDLTNFLRERLRNNGIQVTGAFTENTDKKVIYTNREKFDFLAEKNPVLKELKDRLGLDTDF